MDQKISFLINYFNTPDINHDKNISKIINKLKIYENSEILWNNDSSSDKQIFDEYMKDINGEVIYSNNIGELRGYNLLMRKSVGDYIVIMQDDDIPPDYNWMQECINIFNKYPKVGIMGLKEGGPIIHLCPCNWSKDIGGDGSKFGSKLGWMYTNPEIKIHFSGWLNNGPIILTKKTLDTIGYYDEAFIKPNNPFSGAEVDLVVRAWLNDIYVLKYKLNEDFIRREGGHASKRDAKTCLIRAQGITYANGMMWKKNAKYNNIIQNKIEKLNKEIFNVTLKSRK
tara:strand:- start:95 stop:943 length:849 start_codon:yes stop_codon:yes gene_type:complete